MSAVAARPERIARVRAVLETAGLTPDIREFSENTATAPQAAAALGCDLEQIAKTLVFKRRDDDSPVVVMVRGVDRVDEKAVAEHIGGKIKKADAEYIRACSGYEIGGVTPIDWPAQVPLLMDSGLRALPLIWVAAGSAHAVFSIAPETLADLTGAQTAAVAAAPPN